MKAFLAKLHPAGILALAVSILGVLSEPSVLGLMPENVAHIVTVAGLIAQAITRSVSKGDVIEVKKEAFHALPYTARRSLSADKAVGA